VDTVGFRSGRTIGTKSLRSVLLSMKFAGRWTCLCPPRSTAAPVVMGRLMSVADVSRAQPDQVAPRAHWTDYLLGCGGEACARWLPSEVVATTWHPLLALINRASPATNVTWFLRRFVNRQRAAPGAVIRYRHERMYSSPQHFPCHSSAIADSDRGVTSSSRVVVHDWRPNASGCVR
jgi:hypothetical protein